MRSSAPQRLPASPSPQPAIVRELRSFEWNGRPTKRAITSVGLAKSRPIVVETFVNEFWTSQQRAAHSLHEVSYRACFKPQLPRFFIDRFTRAGRRRVRPVHGPRDDDGRSGARGADAGRLRHQSAERDPRAAAAGSADGGRGCGSASSRSICRRRCRIRKSCRSSIIPTRCGEICALREYLLDASDRGTLDGVDRWIRMVAVNRLTGHSPGFFSVYTLPPNQAVSLDAQAKINARRKQIPPRRDVRALIVDKNAIAARRLRRRDARDAATLGATRARC